MPILDFLSDKVDFLKKGILSLDKDAQPDAKEDSISQQSTVDGHDKKLHPIIEPISEMKFRAHQLVLNAEIEKINSLAQTLQEKMKNDSEYSKLQDDEFIDPNQSNDLNSTLSFGHSVDEDEYINLDPELINKSIKKEEEKEEKEEEKKKSIRERKDLQVKKPLEGKKIMARQLKQLPNLL